MRLIRRISRILPGMNKQRVAFAAGMVVLASIIPRSSPAQQREQVRGWVGVAYTTGVGQADRNGNLVFTDYPVIESIEPNSPAERAGLATGDMIIAMNSQDLKRSPLPTSAMLQPGRKIVFRFKRGDDTREVTVTVAPRPEGTSERLSLTIVEPRTPEAERAPEMSRRARVTAEVGARTSASPIAALPPLAFGFGPRSLALAGAELTGLNAELRSLVGLNQPGIFVVNVALGTPAKESGLRPADVIVKADGLPVGDPGELIRVMRQAVGSSIRLEIFRKKRPQTITLRW
jgi:S1-C subfamily serine protease